MSSVHVNKSSEYFLCINRYNVLNQGVHEDLWLLLVVLFVSLECADSVKYSTPPFFFFFKWLSLSFSICFGARSPSLETLLILLSIFVMSWLSLHWGILSSDSDCIANGKTSLLSTSDTTITFRFSTKFSYCACCIVLFLFSKF